MSDMKDVLRSRGDMICVGMTLKSRTLTTHSIIIIMVMIVASSISTGDASSVARTLLASRIRALQEMQTGKTPTPFLATLLNSTIITQSVKPTSNKASDVNGKSRNSPKTASGRYYPEVGPLSVREVIAKEAFRLAAQLLLDRLPAK